MDQPAIDSIITSLVAIEEQLGMIHDDRAQSAGVYVDAVVRLLRRPNTNEQEPIS